MSHQVDYVTLEEFKSSVSIQGTVKDDDVRLAIGAASRAIERITSRRFWLDEEDVTLKFTATSTRLVVIDDLSELTSVTSAGADVTDDVLPDPFNANVRHEPFTRLLSPTRQFSTGDGEISVTGRFGWPEIPEQVRQIVTIVASKLLKRTREAPWGIVTSGGIDGMSLRITRDDPDLQFLTGTLMRNYPPVA